MKGVYKVAVIGGGFSGLICAEILSSHFGGDSVLLLEKNDRVGKKILATGNGRGNVTNVDLSSDKYHSVCGANVSSVLEKYGNKSIIDYFNGLGVDFSVEDGKVYPSSFQANSILDMLRLRLDYLGTEINVSSEVKSVRPHGEVFLVATESERFFAQSVIFACGGKAGKQYGTDGTAYKLLTELGHSITELFPSLVQVKTDTAKIKGLKGLKQQAEASVLVKGKRIKSFTGDILFTDFGVSGNAIFYLSAYLPKNQDAEISISFLPDKSEDEIAGFILRKFNELPYVGVEDVLVGVINKLIGRAIVKDCGQIAKNEKGARVIASRIKNFRLSVKGTLGFDNAQVTKGGIRSKEIDFNNMESKIQSGLFVVGEMLDVDGDCGGYNLQWAYSSARVACDGVISKDENR